MIERLPRPAQLRQSSRQPRRLFVDWRTRTSENEETIQNCIVGPGQEAPLSQENEDSIGR